MDKAKTRNLTLDAMKAISIILVAYGHIPKIEGYVAFGGFKMHLFMLVSGYLSYSLKHHTDLKWIKTRALRLFLPYWIWIAIKMYTKFKFNPSDCVSLVIRALKSPDVSYWFLFLLFELCLLLFVCNLFIDKVLKGKYDYLVYIGSVIVLNIIVWVIYFHYLGLYQLSIYSCPFLLGYFIHKHDIDKKLKPVLNNKVLWGLILVFATWLFYGEHTTAIYDKLSGLLSGLDWQIRDFTVAFIKYFVPLIGVYYCYAFVKVIPNTIVKYLAFIGQYTMEIYILHYFFFFEYSNNVFIYCTLNLIVPIVISLFITYIVENGLLPALLFGKDYPKTLKKSDNKVD